MNRIVAVILAIVLSVASATAGIRHYCDYQGNVRQVVDTHGNVLEQNDYYPYGGLFGESASWQNYKYSGKELETMNGLNTYDFHARPYYYPVLLFHSPDFFSEKYYHVSPYLYCLGNPIKYTDPTGMRVEYAENMTSKQRANLDYIINDLKNNELFKAVFQSLELSDNVITIQIGETMKDSSGENVPGQFKPNAEDNTGGTITYSDKHEFTYVAIAEELYHAYQNLTPNDQDASTNFELEAKVFTIGIGCGKGSFQPLETIEKNIHIDKYGSENNIYTKSKLEYLEKDYLKAGQDFVKYHKQNGSNSNYIVPVLFMPQRLINLIK